MENNNTTALAKVSVKQLLDKDGSITYAAPGNVEVALTMGILKNLVRVRQGDPQPTDADMLMFAYACASQGLNPYLEDCWLVYMPKKGWTPLVSAQSRVRKAQTQPDYRGYEWGWITADGKRHPAGPKTEAKPDDGIIGLWGSVNREGRTPFYHEIFAAEYPTNQGQKHFTMLLKVIRDQTHKFAYADKMGNLMTENEAHFVDNGVLVGGEPKSKELLEPAVADGAEVIPDPDAGLTAEEAAANLDEKLHSYKFKCNACGEQFDEPAGGGKKPLCPKCLSKDVQDFTEETEQEKE